MYPPKLVEARADAVLPWSACDEDGTFTAAAITAARERAALLRDFIDDEDAKQALQALPEEVVSLWLRYILSDTSVEKSPSQAEKATRDEIHALCRLLEVRQPGPKIIYSYTPTAAGCPLRVFACTVGKSRE